MKSAIYLFLVIVCLMAASCSEKETAGGVKYKVLKKGDGKEIDFGQFLVMNFTLKDSKDSLWFSSKPDLPVIIPYPDGSMDKSETEYSVFRILTKGDSVSFQLTAQTVFTKSMRAPVPKNIDSTSLLTFNVGVRDLWSQQQVDEFQKRMELKRQREITKKDSTTISAFLNEKGIVALSTASGLRYVVKKEGKGPLATTGKMADVHYAGYLLNGKLFDTSWAKVAKENNFNNGNRNEPYPVVVNTGSVIPGWDEMLLLMNKGMKVTVYIPSALAYGERSPGREIPPGSVLVFDMEVMDIK